MAASVPSKSKWRIIRGKEALHSMPLLARSLSVKWGSLSGRRMPYCNSSKRWYFTVMSKLMPMRPLANSSGHQKAW